MRKIIFTLFGVALLSACSESYLDIKPEDQIKSENFFKTKEDALASVSAIYTNLRTWDLAAFAPIILSVSSDDADKGSSPGDAPFFDDIKNFTFTASAGIIEGYWSGQFRGVNLANQTITNVPNIDMDDALKTRLLAEARFFRAYHYFNLVKLYGGVPIYDGLPADGNYNRPRNSKDEVYNFILADLKFAEENLPANYGATDIGRATKGAARAYEAKAHMYLGNWDKVLSITNQVMGMGYGLLPSYNSVFRIEFENSIESILEVQCTYVSGNCDLSNSQFSQVQGVRDQFGWGFNVPSQNLSDSYEAGDVRRDATIIYRGETTPEKDYIKPTGDNPMYNQKAYVPSGQIGNCSEGSEQNIRLMRFAEVLLMNAEAANEIGDTGLALASVNKIRQRASLPALTSMSKDQLRLAIWKERRSEMGMENDRFLDLVRQGRGPAVLGPQGFTAGKNELFPIPAQAISLSNGILKQNPGY
ncbi:RagB/SusD family nutrient uptake outer membrane protein [Flavobacterium sp. EDS]|uniref:RagB/SusD family nutrient uptake outer membrane protein n=1 Tax=Flavobacterium sp. EDS TaxID=2897328 RepID=UPI001E3536B1|nr:RagB/SusD family nutrient uptake outer membrane protein [Flavobacterium sp. EDS]MCD0473893.1 RagB/SusD family nutrient uptake outer membrane protein [Flavobacterium sp. EDS]